MRGAERDMKGNKQQQTHQKDTTPPSIDGEIQSKGRRVWTGWGGGSMTLKEEYAERVLTMEGMLFLAPGGMSTRRSGLRLFMPRFMGGGDLACMFLFMPPGETSRPGELRWFPYPFPERAEESLAERRCTLNMPISSNNNGNKQTKKKTLQSCLITNYSNHLSKWTC